MIVNKAFLTVVDNRGINGFPFGMIEFGKYYLTGIDEKIKDRIQIGDPFSFIEKDSLTGLTDNKLRFYMDAPYTYDALTLGSGREGVFKGFLIHDKYVYAWTGDGVAKAHLKNTRRWIWNKNGLADRDILKIEYNSTLGVFIILTAKEVYISRDECETYFTINFRSISDLNNALSITGIGIREYKDEFDVIFSEIVIGTSDGIYYTRIEKTFDWSLPIAWTSATKRQYIEQFASSYPDSLNRVDPMSVIRKVQQGTPLSDKINSFIWIKEYSLWLFDTPNGMFYSSDLITFIHITAQKEPDFTPWPIIFDNGTGGETGEGEPGSIWPEVIITVAEWNLSNKFFYVNNIVHRLCKDTPSLYKLTGNISWSKINVFEFVTTTVPGTGEQVITQKTRDDIVDYTFGFGIHVVVLSDNTMLYSFDNLTTFFKRNPVNGYTGKTVKNVFKLPDRFIFGTDTGIVYSIEDRVRLSFLCVNRNNETKQTYPGIMPDSNLFEFTIALHDSGKLNNPIIRRSLRFQNKQAQYVFILMTATNPDGKVYRKWYLIGKEPRYSEMKAVAAEFGVG